MTKLRGVSLTVERILENIIFLEEVFGSRADEEIPDIPILELANSFELKKLEAKRLR